MLERYAEFCYNQVGSYILDYLKYFEDLRPQLSRANIEVSLPEYVAMMAFSGILSSIMGFFLLSALFITSMGPIGLIYALAASIILSAATLMGFYLYPSVLMRNRASKIRDKLPFATLYMSTLAGTGTPIQRIFTILAEEEEYGEVAKEAEKIHRDIEVFGLDLSEALRNAAERTPNEDFKDLMWGMNHVITSGGSLRSFLQERAQTLMNEYQRRVEEFSEQLGLLVEMYITLVIVGSIIFTSMSAVMSSFAKGSITPGTIVTLQILAIFIVLPLISGMFIILVKGLAPGGVR